MVPTRTTANPEIMKKIFTLCILLFHVTILAAQYKDYPIQAVPFTSVELQDKFWLPRVKINHTVTIPASFERCESTGRVRNFEMAAAKSGKFCTVFPFDDTDIYKTIEGASFSLRIYPDKKLELYMDTLIAKVAAAQEPDGYLYTARTINPDEPHAWAGKTRWEKERELSHELYNSGHLYEAAAAHFQATGKRNLLDIALRNADLVCATFGPDKRHVAPGHQVIEMGLVKLYRITGKKEYLETAKYFIDERGHFDGYDPKNKDLWKNGAYWQDHIPAIQQREAMGHAVRAGYLYASMADVAALTGDAAYLEAIDSLWQNVVGKKIYIQGGIGAIPNGERFGENYELPNATAYNETCAAIANVYWNHRMFLLHGESKYIDVLERSLYNGLISGVGMDGKSFFYTNAMEVKNSFLPKEKEVERSGWFPCSCCPTNVTRLIPSVPGYIYAQQQNKVYVNLFIAGEATVTVNKKPVKLVQQNNYPWAGDLKITVSPTSALTFDLLVRIPGWARNEVIASNLYTFAGENTALPIIKVNGTNVTFTTDKGYAVISRKWKKGDVVELNLPMTVNKIHASTKVVDDLGKVAIQRGPLVYCAEWPDNGGHTSGIVLPESTTFQAEFNPQLLQGVMVLKAEAPVVEISPLALSTEKKPIQLIPYYAWAHRGKGEMQVWFPEKISSIDIISK
jgi:uncharacterized protein